MFQFLFCNLFTLIQINKSCFVFLFSSNDREKTERYKAYYIYPWHRTTILFNIVVTLPSTRKNLRDNRRASWMQYNMITLEDERAGKSDRNKPKISSTLSLSSEQIRFLQSFETTIISVCNLFDLFRKF